MITIGLICEGVSEINIMTRIISKYLDEEPFINPIEPDTRVERGHLVQNGYGGWMQVLRHCNDETITNILEYNDYLVIQIDSDASIQPIYGVTPFNADGSSKEIPVLYNDIMNRLQMNLSKEILEKYYGRLLFAICINEIECWLLPLYYTDRNRCKTHNCIFSLNKALSRKNMGRININDKNNSNTREVYTKVLKNFRNRQSIQECAQYQYSFAKLLEQLDLVNDHKR